VTPSPEPQSAPEADRSADFDSFLDDFDPSDGDNTARVEDASAWLDGSPGGPALSPDATNARPSAGNDVGRAETPRVPVDARSREQRARQPKRHVASPGADTKCRRDR
jgi:hypothetical protein